ncbi:hypothetical protein WJX74_003036 [Apatococcus lobatus]|uniref:Centrosomal protein of 162 kDa n=1 Tax=Apatococcus lobatus TaxID=904363 RepID=A0AAW1QZJ4_9CHLO
MDSLSPTSDLAAHLQQSPVDPQSGALVESLPNVEHVDAVSSAEASEHKVGTSKDFIKQLAAVKPSGATLAAAEAVDGASEHPFRRELSGRAETEPLAAEGLMAADVVVEGNHATALLAASEPLPTEARQHSEDSLATPHSNYTQLQAHPSNDEVMSLPAADQAESHRAASRQHLEDAPATPSLIDPTELQASASHEAPMSPLVQVLPAPQQRPEESHLTPTNHNNQPQFLDDMVQVAHGQAVLRPHAEASLATPDIRPPQLQASPSHVAPLSLGTSSPASPSGLPSLSSGTSTSTAMDTALFPISTSGLLYSDTTGLSAHSASSLPQSLPALSGLAKKRSKSGQSHTPPGRSSSPPKGRSARRRPLISLAADAAQNEFMGPDSLDDMSEYRPEPRVDGGLITRVRELQATNEQLSGALSHKTAEADSLRELAEAVQQQQAATLQARKIMELSRKARGLQLVVERERARTAAAEAELHRMQALQPTFQSSLDPQSLENACRHAVDEASHAAEVARRDAQSFKEKWEYCAHKLHQNDVQVGQLKSERDRYARALLREVGDEVPMEKVLDEGSDWRGRAQQISLLRDRVREASLQQGTTGMSTGSRHNSRHRAHLESMRAGQQQETERLRSEVAAFQNELDRQKLRSDSAVARMQTRAAEMKSIKAKLAVLLDKNSNDDKLIEALRAELVSAKSGSNVKAADVVSKEELFKQIGALQQAAAVQHRRTEDQHQLIQALKDQLHAAAALDPGLGTDAS